MKQAAFCSWARPFSELWANFYLRIFVKLFIFPVFHFLDYMVIKEMAKLKG
jgi:hypothetical protein